MISLIQLSFLLVLVYLFFLFFFFNDTATTEIYTLSLHDALPIFHSLRLSRRKLWNNLPGFSAKTQGAVGPRWWKCSPRERGRRFSVSTGQAAMCSSIVISAVTLAPTSPSTVCRRKA